jgi:UDP-2,3-diacylglucosamine pyrophosphatase LpxH
MIKYKTIIVSDIHLGTKASKVNQVVRFLKLNPCELLVLNGDIIDGWRLKKRGKWRKKDTRFFKTLLDLLSQYNTRVVYLRGNHDEFIEEIAPLLVGNFEIRRDLILELPVTRKKYFILHGDVFDSVTSRITWLSRLGGTGYEILLAYNKRYNRRRIRKGLPYRSVSQVWKDNVKIMVNYLSKFEDRAHDFAKMNHCHGIICGHVHKPADKMLDGIHYLNSGDWVESLSALVLGFDEKWKIIHCSDPHDES